MNKRQSDFKVLGLQALLKSRNPEIFVEGLVRAAAHVCGADRSAMHLIEPGGQLRPYSTYNFPDDYLETPSAWAIGSICSQRALLHQDIWISQDLWNGSFPDEYSKIALVLGIRSALSVPVFDQDRECIGTLDCQSNRSFAPSEFTTEIVSQIADLIGYAFSLHPKLRGGERAFSQSAGTGAYAP